MKNDLIEVEAAIQALEKWLPANDGPLIEAGGNPSEAVVIGTKGSYVRAAVELLKIVGALQNPNTSDVEFDTDEICGRRFLFTNHVKHIFGELGEVWPVCAYVVDTEEDVSFVRSHYRSGEN